MNIQAAAERLRRLKAGESMNDVYGYVPMRCDYFTGTPPEMSEELWNDRVAIEKFALPLLNETAADDSWLASLFVCRDHAWIVRRQDGFELQLEACGDGYELWVCDDGKPPVPLAPIKTRGQLRTLCLALGIELREGE